LNDADEHHGDARHLPVPDARNGHRLAYGIRSGPRDLKGCRISLWRWIVLLKAKSGWDWIVFQNRSTSLKGNHILMSENSTRQVTERGER
jgi:hypothetical protein